MKIESKVWNPKGTDCWICLHGYLDEPNLFRKLANRVPKNTKIVGWKSPVLSANSRIYSLEELATSVERLRLELGINKVSILGFSLGGLVAVKYGHLYPGSIKKMVLLNSVPTLVPVGMVRWVLKTKKSWWLNRKVIDGWVKLSKSNRIRKIFGLPKIGVRKQKLLEQFGYGIGGTFLSALGENLIEEYNQIKVPKVVINFRNDEILRWAGVRMIWPQLNGKRIVIARKGHATGADYWDDVVKLLGDGEKGW